MAITKTSAVEQHTLGAARIAGPSREEAEKREGEIGVLAEGVVQKLAAEHGEKASYLILGAFLAAAGEGEQPGPVYYGPWPKLMDEAIKAVRASKAGYGEALCGAAERLLVTDAKAQKLLPPDYQPPKS